MSKVYYNMDTLFLEFMKGNYSVGVYNAAYRIILFILGFWFIFGNVTFPAITQLSAVSSESLARFLSILVRLALTVSLPIAIGGTILGGRIVAFVYPHGFEAGAGAFQILIWSVLIVALSTTYANSLIALDKAKKYMWAVTFGAVANTGLNLLLIPEFDFIGAAVATVLTEAVIFVYLYRELQSICPFQVERIKRIAIASALMGMFVYFVRDLPVLLSIGLGTGVYVGLLVSFKGYTRDEFLTLKKSLSRSS
jgi:O-antigen/teichoic acid export membrane protein